MNGVLLHRFCKPISVNWDKNYSFKRKMCFFQQEQQLRAEAYAAYQMR